MNKPKIKQTTNQLLAKEGYKPIVLCAILMLAFIFLGLSLFAMLIFIIILFMFAVFRNTERICESRDKDAIIAPCDGIIKEIEIEDSRTILLLKIKIFDNGIFRVPICVNRVESIFRFGLFIKGDKKLQEILNTRHIINGFSNGANIFSITLLPELWNKVSIYEVESPLAGDRLGFMKYGYLKLVINAKTSMKVKRGDSIIAGESLLGRLL